MVSRKSQTWYVRVEKTDKLALLRWVRRAGTAKKLCGKYIPDHVREYMCADEKDFIDMQFDKLPDCENLHVLKDCTEQYLNGRISIEIDEKRESFRRPPTKSIRLVHQLMDEFGEEGLFDLYRNIYKYTDCGPSIGFEVYGLPSNHKARPDYGKGPEQDKFLWIYCDTLRTLPSLKEMEKKGWFVTGVSISSIVEGSDVEVEPVRLDSTNSKKDFWKAVEDVNKEASFYWERDNSQWFFVKGPEDEFCVRNTWGEIVWEDGEKPDEKVYKNVEKFIHENGNRKKVDGLEGCTQQDHPYDEYFPVPGVKGWTMCEWLNDSTW